MARPIIGITMDHEVDPERAMLRDTYYDAVHLAGGLPLLIAPIVDAAYLDGVLDLVDGLLMCGGDDLHPSLWGEAEVHPACTLVTARRQGFDLACVRALFERQLPTLAICCGMQALNVSLGGAVIQDLSALEPGAGPHKALPGEEPIRHPVGITPGSLLSRIAEGAGEVVVNSMHHQACGRLGRGLRCVARAADGVVEAIEATDGSFCLGVQWHPEKLMEHSLQRRLFEALCREAERRHTRGPSSATVSSCSAGKDT